jgi:hypothetical protein
LSARCDADEGWNPEEAVDLQWQADTKSHHERDAGFQCAKERRIAPS